MEMAAPAMMAVKALFRGPPLAIARPLPMAAQQYLPDPSKNILLQAL
jgi:hypothetical protein